MTEAEIRAALERAERATEGPWTPMPHPGKTKYDHGWRSVCEVGHIPGQSNGHMVAVPANRMDYRDGDNTDFIAHARTDVPDLARDLLAARERIERLERVVEATRLANISMVECRGRESHLPAFAALNEALAHLDAREEDLL